MFVVFIYIYMFTSCPPIVRLQALKCLVGTCHISAGKMAVRIQ